MERFWAGRDIELLGAISAILLVVGLLFIGLDGAFFTALGVVAVILSVIGILFATAFFLGS